MFGEYALYCDGKTVAFITDDTLYIKPSNADPALFERTEPGHAYPGSKLYHGVPGDALEDREWLTQAIQATADALPVPKPKTPRASSKDGGR
jgi:TfoX/Sxy family transcriptional regulator of competence genes